MVCKIKGCKCKCYEYIPVHGSYDFKCLCKHSYKVHDPNTKQCKKCNKCSGFNSTWSCSCLLKYSDHVTIIETLQERVHNGKPLTEVEQILMDPMIHGQLGPPQLNSFMDLVDGAERYGARVEKMEEERKALGYKQNPALGYGEEDSLTRMNREIQRGKDNGVLAYDLFMKPHNIGGGPKRQIGGINKRRRKLK